MKFNRNGTTEKSAYYQLQAMEAIVRTLEKLAVEQRQLSLWSTPEQ